jgi:TrkA domain protein
VPIPERLPTVGHLLDLHDEDGHPVQVVRRKDGTLEVHADGRTTILDPVQAQALGLLASGHIVVKPELVARTSAVLGGLELDWVTVAPGAAAVGRSIEQLAIRRRTGTTIVAILRGSLPVVDPDPQERLQVGDELVVACRPEQRDALERYLVDGA